MSNQVLSPQLLLSRKQAAIALAISVRMIDYLIASKQLPARRIGRRLLIPYEVLRRFSARDHPYPYPHKDGTKP